MEGLTNLSDNSSFFSSDLDGPDGSYRYLLSARDGRMLERVLLDGASRRLNRRISSLSTLGDTYYRVGPVEQYLMSTGRVFLVAFRDNRDFEQVLEAATPAEEATLIANLCALIRERDPDTIENHNLMGFDLPSWNTVPACSRSRCCSDERARQTVWSRMTRRDQQGLIAGSEAFQCGWPRTD